MKYSIYSIFFALILACNSQKEGESDQPSLEISMDTVMIDPGQEILFLNAGLITSALSEDKKYLYNVNSTEHSIEQINLNTLAFEKKYPFEKEGPNGVGNYLRTFSLINDDAFFISTIQHEHIFNWKGEKLESFNISEMGIEQNQLEEGDLAFKTISLSPDGNQFASLITNWGKKTTSFALIDRKNKSFIKMVVPGIEKTKNFELTLRIVGGSIENHFNRFLLEVRGKVILGTEISSELYVLDKISDSLRHITYKSRLTPNEKSGTYPTEVEDKLQFENYHRKIEEDITFMEPVWDEKKQVFYRLSFLMIYDENAEAKEGQLYIPSKGAEVYLSILDKDLNLIAEGPFQTMDSYPGFHFGKDGKLWLFKNIADEMGFVRLDVSW